MDESIEFGSRRLYADLYHEVGTDFEAIFEEKEALFEEAEQRGDGSIGVWMMN